MYVCGFRSKTRYDGSSTHHCNRYGLEVHLYMSMFSDLRKI